MGSNLLCLFFYPTLVVTPTAARERRFGLSKLQYSSLIFFFSLSIGFHRHQSLLWRKGASFGGMETSWRRVDVMRSFARLGGEVLFKVQFFFFLSHLFRSFYFFFLMSVATITGGGKGNYTIWRSLDLKGERTSLKDHHMLGVKENCYERRGVEHGRRFYCSYRRRQSSKWWPLLSLMKRSWVFTFPFFSFLFFCWESVFGVCGYSW